jgi:hypothetical protein
MDLLPQKPVSNTPKVERALRHDESRRASGLGLYVRRVFSHFQNLNLRVLIEDLRRGWITRGSWSFAGDLCPVAHGLADGQCVKRLQYISQAVDLRRACELAAQQIGAPDRTIEHLVTSWDTGSLGADWLLEQLEAIWGERLADAQIMQAVLSGDHTRLPVVEP